MSGHRSVPAVLRIDINIMFSSMPFQVTPLTSQASDEVLPFQVISIVSSVESNFSTTVGMVSCIIRA